MVYCILQVPVDYQEKSRVRTQGSSQEAGLKAEVMEERLLTGLSHLPRGGTAHTRLIPHVTTSNQENVPQTLPRSDGANP